MQPFSPTNQVFAADQQWDFSVTSWDTPYTVLEGGVASGGIIFDLVEPKDTSAVTWKTFVDTFKAQTQNALAVTAFTTNANIVRQVANGRVDNLISYWAGGAPGQHGATVSGRVAYHFRGYIRTAAARSWFSTITTPSWFLALAGNGYFRIDKSVGGAVTTIFTGSVTEKDYLVNGYVFTPTIADMTDGDFLDIYYVQTGAENWGGYVVKAVSATRSTDPVDQSAAQSAHVLGCGLCDDNAPPAAQILRSIKSVEVETARGKAMTADMALALLNPAVHDGTGWKWTETSPDDPGILQLYEGGVVTVTLKRKRLIRIVGGFQGEQYTLFTGLVKDFSEPSGATTALSCQGFEINLLEQYDKNYPDPVSYMARGYRRTTSASGTTEPIYPIPAYDNWPVEYTVADLLVRNGIDASRLVKPLTVALSDGTSTPVIYKTYNAFKSSQAIDSADWTKSVGGVASLPVVTPNFAAAPDGTLTADRVQFALNGGTTTTDLTNFSQGNTPAVTGSWTHAVWIKSNTVSTYNLVLRNNSQLGITVTPTWKRFSNLSVLDGVAHPRSLGLRGATAGSSDSADVLVWGEQYAPGSVPFNYNKTDTVANLGADDNLFKFRARTLGGRLIRMDRPVHYGNASIGFDESLPADDPYIFKPEVTKEVWNRTREMVERLGYELRFDESGDAVLRPRNNPSGVYEFSQLDSSETATIKTNPSAYAARYMEWSAATVTLGASVMAARIDVSMPIGPTLGSWTYTVYNSSGVSVASGTLTCNGSSTDAYFFDGALNSDASNATVATLYSGDYDVYLVALAATGGAATRRADCLLLYHSDPLKPSYPSSFSTAKNALKVQATSAMDDMRNSVIVVGRRKATVTDSEKFNNPNNPESEFIVERLVDKASITNPLATNFIGRVKETIIFDSSIADNAYARYLARAFIYRYRNPRPPVGIDHTLVPQLQQNDSIYAEETRYNTVSIDGTDPRKSVLWVTGYKHAFQAKTAKTSVSTQSFPDFPAFEPREDIDLSAFNNKPVINLSVVYTSLAGDVKTNLGPSAVQQCAEGFNKTDGVTLFPGDWVQLNALALSSGKLTIPSTGAGAWPPVPGTVFIRPVIGAPTSSNVTLTTPTDGSFQPLTRQGVLPALKLPYQIGFNSATISTRISSVFPGVWSRVAGTSRSGEYWYEIGDEDVVTVGAGSAAPKGSLEAKASISFKQGAKDTRTGWITNNPYHHFFNVDYSNTNRVIQVLWNHGDNASTLYQLSSGATAFDVKYRRLGPVNASTGVFDPTQLPASYASGAGSPFYDPYTSELGYTVNIKADFLVSGLYRVSVRNTDDGTIVAWLTEPTADSDKAESHWQYFTAGANRQFAWDGVDNIGAWNRKQSTAYASAISGAFEDKAREVGAGFYAWNREYADNKPGPLAIIAAQRDASTSEPLFGHGTYSQWYVHVESKTDTTNAIVRSDSLDAANNGGVSSALIFTHLPEPTKAELAIADWSSGSDYNANDTSLVSATSAFNPVNWSTSPSTDATVNNQKPVRLRFKVQKRPGTLFTTASEQQIKLCRAVHLRANIFDQFVVLNGTNWPNSSYEDRTLYNRKLTNDEHTIKYQDDGYRKGSSLKWLDTDAGTEWIFTPSTFQKDFRGFTEAPVFGDYLQLEEVPKWDEGQRNAIAGSRARMQIAFMNYLWYLSAYTTDRSGRSIWAYDRNFLDKSKIVNNVVTDWYQSGAAPTKNSLLQSRSYTVTWTMTSGTATMNHLGIDGTTNTAGTINDNNATAFGVLSQSFTIPNDSNPIAVAFWIAKDSTITRFPQPFLSITGGTTTGERRASFNTSTGTFTTTNTNGPGSAGTTTIEDAGLWWILRMFFNNNTTGNVTASVGVYPAARATEGGADDVAIQGSIVLGQAQAAINSNFISGPLFTTTTAITTLTRPVATSFSYATDWPVDPLIMHRRTVVCRQWADEDIAGVDWRVSQRTKYNLTLASIGDQLLRHKWKDHAPTSTTINGVAWSTFALATDQYTQWHTLRSGSGTQDNSGIDTSVYTSSLARQLTALSSAALWTWEQNPNWVPCITRDFHGYRLVPPMMDSTEERTSTWNVRFGVYEFVDMRPYNNAQNKNEGADAGAGETWTSPMYDMGTTYDSTNVGKVRFWPGHKVSTVEEPTKTRGVLSNTYNYVRQDETVHWEDLRGLFSRGKRPTEQPLKVAPVQPYYMNPYTYTALWVDGAYQNGTYPLFKAGISNWFDMTFRSEYYWESGAFFPVSQNGIEKLEWMNANRTRFLSKGTSQSAVKFDNGAWVGWKDDRASGNDVWSGNKIGSVGKDVAFVGDGSKGRVLTPFEADVQVAGIGPILPETKDMIFHMVLVNERRNAPV